ncbi:MAG TPA: glycosyltransferase family 2 protein, partial [Gammaproteobacteria bacterium]|nr:glycosyltransferase family 2 protein [Gammaproteobacteria bacterium]
MSAPEPTSITVIIPAHQAERFLARALDSVRAQTDPDWALVV